MCSFSYWGFELNFPEGRGSFERNFGPGTFRILTGTGGELSTEWAIRRGRKVMSLDDGPVRGRCGECLCASEVRDLRRERKLISFFLRVKCFLFIVPVVLILKVHGKGRFFKQLKNILILDKFHKYILLINHFNNS